MKAILLWVWNAVVSRTTQNVVGSGLTLGGVLAGVRALWPDLLPWSAETDVWLVSTGAGVLSRLVAFWRTPDKATGSTSASNSGRPTAALLLIGLSLACYGCTTLSAVQADERAQLRIAQETLTATVQGLTAAREAGAFTQDQADQITIVIGQAKRYLAEWTDSVIAGESRPTACDEFLELLQHMQQLKEGSGS